MARAVGLDIGSRTIKVVELSGGPKAFRVQRVAIRDVPTPEEGAEAGDVQERTAEIVRELFESMKLPREDVSATFSAGETLTREITVPFRDDDQIKKVAKYEAENHLHSHSIDDVVVNWVKTGETRDGSRLLILVTPKEDLADRLAMLRRAGIEPASVDLDVTALYTACDASGVFVEKPNVILLDLGARTTNLVLVSGGRPRMMRSFLAGVEGLEAAIREAEGSPADGARAKARIGAGARPDDLIVPASALEAGPAGGTDLTGPAAESRLAFVQKLHREAYRSIAAVGVETPPDRILLAGGGSVLPGVAESLSERFGLPVEHLDLAEKLFGKDLGPDPEFAKAALPPAIGCGLRLLGHNPLGIELLKEEFSPTNVFEVVKVALATGLTLLCAVAFLLAFGARSQADAEKLRYRNEFAAVKSIFQVPEKAYLQAVKKETAQAAEQETAVWLDRTLPQDATRIDAIRKRLLQRHRELEGSLGLAKDIPAVQSALEVWYQLYHVLSSVPREELGQFFRINDMDITERQCAVTVEADNGAILDKVTLLLERSEYFKDRSKRPMDKGRIVEKDGHSIMKFTFTFKEDD
jgi:type IV pilus assembly protein PilM